MTSLESRYDPAIAERLITSANDMGGIPAYLGIELVRFTPARLEARAFATHELTTPSGNVHGGALAAMLDHVTGAVVYPLMPDGYWGATAELKINYVAPAPPGVLDLEATVIAMSNRSAVVRSEIRRGERLLCAAQGGVTLVAPSRDKHPTGQGHRHEP